ncbi:IS701 family transposase [Streptomyces sp. NPDC097981]|uniref:IS701 family transposase n=1 Tax=Streptomyces sp. NPDC097981 TaxID=3155428 RepID=UPI003330E542
MDAWAADIAQVACWDDKLEELLLSIGDVFPRVDLRGRARACVRGLLGPVSRKNGWQLAEYAGWDHPWLQQHLLDRARWEADELRDRVRHYAMAGLADGAGGVLVVDETGFAKKGDTSVGVARQFSGTLGGVFPCQVGVMAAWATSRGQALVDRELYLPRPWTEDRARCEAAHVPEAVAFATKPRLAEKMIERIWPECPHGTWAAADEVYGRDGAFRAFLEEHRIPYVVNVPTAQTVLPQPGWRRIALLASQADQDQWRLLEAGPSTAGSRWWQWWISRVPDPDLPIGTGEGGERWWCRWMIARRRPEDPAGRHDYYLAWGPADTTPEHLAHVAGARWRVEDAIKLGKHECGLADYEVRSWHGWYRHITLSMLAAAFLAVQAAGSGNEHEEEATDHSTSPARDADEQVKGGKPRTPHASSRSSRTPRQRSASSSH